MGNRARIIAAVVLGVALLWVVGIGGLLSYIGRPGGGAVGRMTALATMPFDIRGQVVDEQGTPLADVEIQARAARMVRGGSGPIREPQELPEPSVFTDAEGRFHIRVENRMDLTLTPVRPGYYQFDHRFSSPASDPAMRDEMRRRYHAAAAGTPLPPLTVTERDRRIVLVKQGTLTRLDERRGELVTRPDYSGTVLGFEPTAEILESAPSEFGFRRVDDVRDDAAQAVPFIYIDVERDPQTGAMVKVPIERNGRVAWVPRTIYLRSTAQRVGFRPIEFPQRETILRDYGLDTRVAPVDGYVSELAVSGEVVLHHDITPKGGDLAFYWFDGAHYGRGSLNCQVPTDQEWRATLQLFVQRDGTTNLEDGKLQW